MKPDQKMVREIPRHHWVTSPRKFDRPDDSNRTINQSMRTQLLDPLDGIETIDYHLCPACDGEGSIKGDLNFQAEICQLCSGNTAIGVDPLETKAYPGSEEKIAILAARYAQGLPMHIEQDINVGGVELPELLQLT